MFLKLWRAWCCDWLYKTVYTRGREGKWWWKMASFQYKLQNHQISYTDMDPSFSWPAACLGSLAEMSSWGALSLWPSINAVRKDLRCWMLSHVKKWGEGSVLCRFWSRFWCSSFLEKFLMHSFFKCSFKEKKNDIRHNLLLPDTMTTHNEAVSLVASRHIWERHGYSHLPLIYLPASPWLWDTLHEPFGQTRPQLGSLTWWGRVGPMTPLKGWRTSLIFVPRTARHMGIAHEGVEAGLWVHRLA